MTVSNIAAAIQQPNILGMAGNIVNLASAGQQFQQQQIETQTMQQQNQERQAVNSVLAQHPEWINPDGTFKMDKVAPAIMYVAPQTGQDKIAKMVDTNNRMTNANQAVQNLGKDSAQIVNQNLYAMKGMDPSDRAPLIDAMRKQFPSTAPLWDQYSHMLNVIQGTASSPTANGYDAKAAMQKFDGYWTQFAKNQADQQAQTQGEAPKYSTQQFGKNVQVTQSNANAPGGVTGPLSPSGTVSAGVQPQYITDPGGNLHVLPGTAGGIAQQAGNISQPAIAHPSQRSTIGQPISSSAATIPGAWVNNAGNLNTQANTQGVIEARNSALGAPAIRNTIGNILPILDQADAKVGPGADKIQAITGPLNTISGGKWNPGANAYSEIDAYANRLALQTAQQFGQNTVAGTLMAQAATGHPAAQTKEALQDKLRYIDGLTTLGQAYGQGLSAAAGTGQNQNPNAKNAYDQKFISAYGTDGADVFRIKADYDRGDPKSIADAEAIISRSKRPRSYWVSRADQMNEATGGFLYNK
jgi:hypothetical protein